MWRRSERSSAGAIGSSSCSDRRGIVTKPSARLNAVTERFDQLLTKLNDGQGTAGQLLKDKQLYENMNGAVGDFRALMGEIRKNPKKYLNVKVSIF